jgi:hypothetical protein
MLNKLKISSFYAVNLKLKKSEIGKSVANGKKISAVFQ